MSTSARLGGMCCGLALLAAGSLAGAEDRALLIATTEYADSVFDLPGLELDIEQIHGLVRKLGFADDAIRTLTGTQVTAANVREQFRTFLTDGVRSTDSVFVYYTGHGLQIADTNGDETDRRDEVISMYDLSPAARGWDGVLVDDEIAELLRALPSDNVVVVVDACHSGTVTRGYSESIEVRTRSWGNQSLVIKTLPFRPDRTRGAAAVSAEQGAEASAKGSAKVSAKGSDSGDVPSDAVPSGVVTLSAAQDDQQSYSSDRGSLFTLALGEAFEGQRGRSTPRSLMTAATELLEQRLDAEYRFRPNLTGDASLFEKSIVLGERAVSKPVNRADLLSLTVGLPEFDVVTDRPGYLDGEAIGLIVDVPSAGYLNVLAVDPDDQLVLLYPNRFVPDNAVAPGRIELPSSAAYDWRAQAPWGENLIAVLHSIEPLNLFESSLQKSPEGEPLGDFLLPSVAGLVSVATAEGLSAGTLQVDTCETNRVCGQ